MPKKYLTIAEAAKAVTGRNFSRPTLWRWCNVPNQHGIILDSCVIGNRRMTTIESMEKYIAETTEAANAT